MNYFNKRTAARKAFVSVLLAVVASPVAWYISYLNAEKATVAHAMGESGRISYHFGAIALSDPDVAERADKAAEILAGGLLDISEIYNQSGEKLAMAMTEKAPMSFEQAMSILERDSESHFDPGEINAFQPIAHEIFIRLAKSEEKEVKRLMEERVRVHFGI
ncbi:MAG TPA: hypothetical protein DHV59_18800 [Oxalobacteraceae bacterium]|nr:hypothetical protein [Oxalobacteraceae bacterium]